MFHVERMCVTASSLRYYCKLLAIVVYLLKFGGVPCVVV